MKTYDANDRRANKPLSKDEKEAEEETDRRARERREAEARKNE